MLLSDQQIGRSITGQVRLTLLLGCLALAVVLVGDLDELGNTTLETCALLVTVGPDLLSLLDLAGKPHVAYTAGGGVYTVDRLGRWRYTTDGSSIRNARSRVVRLSSESGNVAGELLEAGLGVDSVRDVCHRDSARASQCQVLGRSQPFLAHVDVMVELLPQEVESPS